MVAEIAHALGGKRMASANRVLEGLGGGKELMLEVSPNYPRDAAGDVEWDEKPNFTEKTP